YEVEIRGVDLDRNQLLFAVREPAVGKPGVLDAIDRVSDLVRMQLHDEQDDAKDRRVRLVDVAGAKPDVMRLYSEGYRLDSEDNVEEARAAYEQALAADPDFPLAHLRLGLRFLYIDFPLARKHIEAALQHMDRVPPKDRLLIQGSVAKLNSFPGDALGYF